MWACDPALTAEIASSYAVAGTQFVQTVQSILAAQCALVGDHLWPDDAVDAVLRDPNYDFIVVGAGSAGSVVANRLTEVPDWKVLLIEAGGNPTMTTEIPQGFFSNMQTPEDWGYKNEPQKGTCEGYETKQCAWPRGKVLGGSSSINGMYYVRGNKLDYDEWAAAGNKGWSYDEVLPYFIKYENYSTFHTEEDRKFHGKNGYLNIDSGSDAEDFEKILIIAASELGVKHVLDVNGPDQMGITRCATTTKNGVRQSTARAFLSPIRDRKNLHVLKNALVTNLLFKPGTDIINGVKVLKDKRYININANKEVILSAGAINTPQLLQISGIGPRKYLENVGIEVKADLPVGENLVDHVYVPIFYEMQGDQDVLSLENTAQALSASLLLNMGPLASTAPNRVISFINTTDSHASSPDIQFHYIIFPPKMQAVVDVYRLHGFNEDFLKKFHEANENNYIAGILAVLLKPQSTGKIILKSKEPTDYPLIYADYFEHTEDLNTILRAVKQHSLKLSETEAFKASGLKLKYFDLEACKMFNLKTDEHLNCWSREMMTSLYHPTSTAKMGPDSDNAAVVDNELRVKKVERLRVIDASIMPNIVRGNTNAPTIMIAEKGADMIKKYWKNSHTEL